MTALRELDALATRGGTVLSVWAGPLDGPPWLTRRADTVHQAASTLKLPLAIAARRQVEGGVLDLDEPVHVHPRFSSAAGEGAYELNADNDNDHEPWDRSGSDVPIGWLLERAIVASSNLATNLLIERVGLAAVNEVYALAGATRSRLRRGIQDTAASAAGLHNTATAGDLAAVVRGLLGGQLLGPDATCDIEGLLAAGEWNDAIPAGLPPNTYVAHKPGWTGECCHDVGVVRPAGEAPLVLAVFTTTRLPEQAAHAVVAAASGIVWRHRPRAAQARAALALPTSPR